MVATRGRMGMTFLIGLVASIVVPVVLMLIAATLIGIPLALLLGFIWLVALFLAGPFAAYLLGHRIVGDKRGTWLIMLVGASILFLLYLLPFVGWIFWLVGTWFGLGAILRLFRGAGRPYHDPGTDIPPVVDKKSGASPA